MVWLYVTYLRIKARILKKKLWYISGSVSRDHNFRGKFRTTERALKRRGILVLNPVKYERNGKAWAWYLKRDLRKLTYCYGLIQLKDWRTSKGSTIEYDTAIGLEMKVIGIENVRESL